MRIRLLTAGLLATALLTAASPLWAQPLDLKGTPPPRERIAPAVPERDLYPQRPSLPHQPRFFDRLTKKTETGRAGVAGFTAPNRAVGSRVAGDHDNPGWPGVGFAIEWGGSSRELN